MFYIAVGTEGQTAEPARISLLRRDEKECCLV